MYRDGTWRAQPAFQSPWDDIATLARISCPAAGFCVAVDDAGYAYTYSAGRWSPGQRIDPHYGVGGASLVSVSCPDPGFCVTVGADGFAYLYARGRWSTGLDVIRNAVRARNGFASVSCASRRFCAAITTSGGVYTYSAGQWRGPRPTAAPFLTAPVVSCPAPGRCVAVSDGATWISFPG